VTDGRTDVTGASNSQINKKTCRSVYDEHYERRKFGRESFNTCDIAMHCVASNNKILSYRRETALQGAL